MKKILTLLLSLTLTCTAIASTNIDLDSRLTLDQETVELVTTSDDEMTKEELIQKHEARIEIISELERKIGSRTLLRNVAGGVGGLFLAIGVAGMFQGPTGTTIIGDMVDQAASTGAFIAVVAGIVGVSAAVLANMNIKTLKEMLAKEKTLSLIIVQELEYA